MRGRILCEIVTGRSTRPDAAGFGRAHVRIAGRRRTARHHEPGAFHAGGLSRCRPIGQIRLSSPDARPRKTLQTRCDRSA
ncbi:hypothetical protein AZ78_0075 [Lysobacter capsici AZ78]|uniref:Uncharacterized protein n=1 Tax=Lysobacter capsici AZ78 TaxID=1444315 RepID=A0A108U4S2_9GAMM|nr:hypothetical protein AZ78_0075 [Lysobacter capsici AZ78]